MVAELVRVADNITLEFTNGIPIYALHPNLYKTVERSAIEGWIEHVLAFLRSQPGPVRLIYDYSRISVLNLHITGHYDTASLGLTASGLSQVDQLFQERAGLQIYLGVVMSVTQSAKVSKA